MTNQETRRRVKHLLATDFTAYAENCLRIRTKDAGIQPFKLNKVQLYMHRIAEKQKAEKGYVRIIVLKGRQQGMSTYIEGRFYWLVTHAEGVRAYILTHAADATDNLFKMVKLFHDQCPREFQPATRIDSKDELYFHRLNSGYKLGTAATKDIGRSSTIQFFHGSECAFWANADTHATGAIQAVPSQSGEIFIESTANGVGDFFHKQWNRAKMDPDSDFIPVFIPWFWQDEYSVPVPNDFYLDDEELEYQEEHDVSDGHMLWRRSKIAEFSEGIHQFRREYPANDVEAFEATGYSQLIPPHDVQRAINNRTQNPQIALQNRGPLILGVDPARFGDDRTVLALRQGRVLYDIAIYQNIDQMRLVGIVLSILEQKFNGDYIDYCYIDAGMGQGVIDRLREMRYVIEEVHFGARPHYDWKYTNRRNEMWQEMAAWFHSENVVLFSPSTEDVKQKEESVLMDVCAADYTFNSKDQMVLEAKKETKRRLGFSPDVGDAIALTFANPYAAYEYPETQQWAPEWRGRDQRTGY